LYLTLYALSCLFLVLFLFTDSATACVYTLSLHDALPILVGFKPSGTDLGVSGFITRSVADAAFLHDITPRSTPARIGVLKQPLFANTRVDPRHLRAVDEAAAHLSAAGYPVEAIEPYPIADVTFESFRHIFTSRLAGMAAGEGYFEW